MEQKEYYCIGEVSSICNISIRTLRYYDEIELIVPEIRKEDSKYRYYSKEQMVTIMYRYAKFAGLDVDKVSATVFNRFPDAESVSEYARPAMIWATDLGLIQGTGLGLEPKASATRAEVSMIIMRYDKLFVMK